MTRTREIAQVATEFDIGAVQVSGTVCATSYYGDGSTLTNIATAADINSVSVLTSVNKAAITSINTVVANVSSTMATSINNSNITIAAVSALTSVNLAAITSINTVIDNLDYATSAELATVSSALATSIANYLPLAGGTITGPTVIEDSSASAILRITQTGSGNALVVEDSTNPDSTPFVVNASGYVGIGETSVSNPLHVKGGDNTLSTIIIDDTAAGGGRKWGLRPGLSGVSNGYFAIYDETAAAARLTITDSGTVDVPGTLTATTFGTSSQNAYGARTVSTSDPTGGSDGDIWYKY